MDNIKVKALCVRAVDYNESDKILTLVTAERGKVTASARGVKKQSAKLKYAAAPFSFGEYMLVPSKNGWFIVADCLQTDGFFELTKDLERYYAGFIVLETADKLSDEHENAQLLVESVRCISEMCYGSASTLYVLSKYFLKVLDMFGYGMNLQSCARCAKPLTAPVAFDFSSGIVCAGCPADNSVRISPGAFEIMRNAQAENRGIKKPVLADAVDGASIADDADEDGKTGALNGQDNVEKAGNAALREAFEVLLLVVKSTFGIGLLSANEYLFLAE